MNDSWQDRDFSFGPSDSLHDSEKPMQKRRFVRKVYSRTTGDYIGEYGLFFPLFCTLVGLLFFGFGIYGFFTMAGDNKSGAVLIGIGIGGPLNLLGYFGLSAYITGLSESKLSSGSPEGFQDDYDGLD